MQHLPIVKSIIRVALGNESPALRHQVERLVTALQDEGDTRAANAIKRLLTAEGKTVALAPAKITTSAALARRHVAEPLTPGVPVPVDKETSAPLATVVFPEETFVELPLFPENVQANISALLDEWTNADRIAEAGMRAALSCLIYGPPGTGKTTLALWMARTLGMPAVVARLDGLISSFLGTTARNLGTLFAFANRYNCVLILDEFDAIAKVRDDPNEVGEIKRVVNALLQNMDARDGRGIVIGITNHEALLDPAIWRRFEVQLAVPLPQMDQRRAIAHRLLDSDDSAAEAEALLLSWVSEGLSGAELATMVMKYRKRRLLSDDGELTPVTAVGQLAESTSNNVDRARASSLLADEHAVAQQLYASGAGFSQGDLAVLLKKSTRTIGRRLSESTEGENHDQ
jgi:MoxR-like ATPase